MQHASWDLSTALSFPNPLMSAVKPKIRAETPPEGYWRRWCADADAPEQVIPESVVTGVSRGEGGDADFASLAGRKVLVVEDDRSQALFVGTVLQGAGLKVRVISRSDQTTQEMAAFKPDLVLVDLHMPAMDGIELTRMIRARADADDLPVLILSGDTDPASRRAVLQAGADEFIAKPVRPRQLLESLQFRLDRVVRTDEPLPLPRTDEHGLYPRKRLLQQLARRFPGPSGGVLAFVELSPSASVTGADPRAMEAWLVQAGGRLSTAAGSHQTARLNERIFLVFAVSPPQDVSAWGRMLKAAASGVEPPDPGAGARFQAHVGIIDLAIGYSSINAALSAAEQTLRRAGTHPDGLAIHRPDDSPGPSPGDRHVAGAARQAIERQVELAFQPIVGRNGTRLAQYQTLLRMRDVQGVVHNASRILQLASSTDLMKAFDRRAMELALSVLRQHPAEVDRLFVSQSANSLVLNGYSSWLLGQLAGLGIDGERLILHLSLADVLAVLPRIDAAVRELSDVGIRCCINHFHPSARAYEAVSMLPVSHVRLSSDLGGEPGQLQATQLAEVVARLHRLQVAVIGAQIESGAVAELMWASDVDFIQGNLIRPASTRLDFDFGRQVD